MKIYRGSTRIVVVVWFIAFKFAKISPIGACIAIRAAKRMKCWEYLWAATEEYPGSFRHSLFRGICANWRERSFYKHHRLAVLMPTYFSLLGLVNIQKAGQGFEMTSDDLFHCIWRIIDGDHLVRADSHTLQGSVNFAKENGHLKIMDYGGPGAKQFWLKWGDQIYQQFDFSFKS